MDSTQALALNQEQLKFWKSNSYIHLPGLFKNQVSQLSDWVGDIKGWTHDNKKWLSFFEMSNPSQLSRIENFSPYHQGFSDLLTKGPIIDLMSALLDEKAVLYKERINFKSPGGGPHAAHQDGVAYDQGEVKEFDQKLKPYLSILISIDEATAQNGCLEVVPNWPLDERKVLPMEAPFKDNPSYTKIAQTVEDNLIWKKLPTQPGDALIFTERLPHRSQPNHSDKTRRIIYGVYNPLSYGNKRTMYFKEKRFNPNDTRYMVGNPHAPTN